MIPMPMRQPHHVRKIPVVSHQNTKSGQILMALSKYSLQYISNPYYSKSNFSQMPQAKPTA